MMDILKVSITENMFCFSADVTGIVVGDYFYILLLSVPPFPAYTIWDGFIWPLLMGAWKLR